MKKMWHFFASIILILQSISPSIIYASDLSQKQGDFNFSDVTLTNSKEDISATVLGTFTKSDNDETVKEINISGNFKLEDTTNQPLMTDSGEQKGTFDVSNQTLHLKATSAGTYQVAVKLSGKYQPADATNQVIFKYGDQTLAKELTGGVTSVSGNSEINASDQTGQTTSKASDTSAINPQASDLLNSKLKALNQSPNDIAQFLPDKLNGSIFDDVSLSYTDADGKPVDKDSITADTKLSFQYNWSIPNELKDGYQLKDGDYYEFKLPENVVYTPGTGSLGDFDDYQIFSDGTVRLTFKNVENYDTLKGTFNYNQSTIKVSEPGPIIIDVPTKSGNDRHEIIIKHKGGNDISKAGRFDKASNPSKVYWDVTINTSGNHLSNASVSDHFPSGNTYESAVVYPLTIDLDGKVTATGAPLTQGVDYEVDASGTVTFIGQYADTYQAFKVTYTTSINEDKKLNDGGDVKFKNTVTLTNYAKDLQASAEVTAKYGKLLDNKFDGISADGSQVLKWHIDYNAGEKTLPAGTKIIDTLVGNQVFYGIPVLTDTAGNAISTSLYTIFYAPDQKTMTVTFPNGLNQQLKIAYQSQITVPIDDISKLAVTNTGESNGKSVSVGSGVVGQQGLVKNRTDVDYTTRTVSWRFDINTARQEMTNWSLEDTIPTGLTVDDSSFIFTDTDSHNKILTRNVDYKVEQTSTGFRVEFLGELKTKTSNRYTLSFKTTFDTAALPTGTTKWTNLGTMKWTDKNGESHTNTGQAEFPPRSDFIYDGNKSGTYNAITKRITWTVGVNLNQRELVNATITDKIPDGQNYVNETAILYTASINKDGSVGNLIKVENVTPVYDDKTQTLSVALPQGSKSAYVLKFDTSLDKQVIDKTVYTNTANYTNNEISNDLYGKVTIKNGDSVIDKGGVQDDKDSAYAIWNIWVNKSQSTVKDVVVTDNPSSNQSIIKDSITVYGSIVSVNGDVVEDTTKLLEQGKDYSIDLQTNSETGKQVLVVKFLKTIDTAYLIRYRAYINSPLVNDVLTNDVSISATGQKEVQGTNTGTIKVVNNKFELYSYTNGQKGALLRSATTDKDGQIKWGNLKSGDYVIVETTTLKGYDIPSDLATGKKITIKYDHADQDNNINITEQNEKTKTSLKGTKVWQDNDNQEGFRPQAITLNLLKEGKIIKSQSVTAASNWSFTFDNLVKFDENGYDIKYSVSEDNVPNYASVINADDLSGIVVTNSRTVTFTTLTGSKIWDDANNQDGIRPECIKINLFGNGQFITSKTVTATDNWRYSFAGLPKYQNAKAIDYTITEDAVTGYTPQINGLDVTNKHTPSKTSVAVSKVWDDANNQDGIRPESIKVQLYADGKISGDAVTLNASNSWATTFNDLAENSQGNPIVYTVKEVDLILGYQATIDDTNKANIVITNTHAPEMVDISGTKTWDDKDNQDGIRPERITVNLLVNGIKTDSKTITAADNWQYTFGELPKFSDGKAIAYVLMEEAVAGYDFSNKGFDITNTHTPDVKSVSITKKWSDKDNQFKSRPDKIQVQLYANGVAFGQPVDVTAKNNWQYTWNELPVKQAGQVVDYTMKEISQVPGYDVSIDASDKDHVVLTNTYTKKVMSQDTSQNLPKTSDTTNPYYLLVGLFLVVLSGIKLFYKKR